MDRLTITNLLVLFNYLIVKDPLHNQSSHVFDLLDKNLIFENENDFVHCICKLLRLICQLKTVVPKLF